MNKNNNMTAIEILQKHGVLEQDFNQTKLFQLRLSRDGHVATIKNIVAAMEDYAEKSMSIFAHLKILPICIKVKHRGKTYLMSPALIINCSTIQLAYQGQRRTLLFAERIEDEKELEYFIKKLAKELDGIDEFKAKKLF